jgi:hypothetical protein
MQKHPIVTLGGVIHAQFVRITAAEHVDERGRGKNLRPAHWLLRLAPLNDPDVEDITLCISDRRAEEAGLVIQ